MHKMLSVYLSSRDKRVPYPTYFLSQFHSLVHEHLSSAEQKAWQVDINKITDYLHEDFDRSNVRTLVFFTAGKKNWQVLHFEFSLPPLMKISNGSYLKPLGQVAGKYQKYLVLLVDREKARLFTVHLGKIEEHQEVFDKSVPQNVKAKKIDYGRDDKIFRHIEGHLNRYLQKIAKEALEFARNKKIQFIILGGHAEMIPKIKNHLPYPLNKKVLGEFVTELNIPLNEVFLHSKQIALKIGAAKV